MALVTRSSHLLPGSGPRLGNGEVAFDLDTDWNILGPWLMVVLQLTPRQGTQLNQLLGLRVEGFSSASSE